MSNKKDVNVRITEYQDDGRKIVILYEGNTKTMTDKDMAGVVHRMIETYGTEAQHDHNSCTSKHT